jgi:dTDP-4-dehydrorhamnose reductase
MVSKKKTVLVTGAAGMLGHKVAEACPEYWKVVTADITEFDITSLKETLAFVKSANPNVLINCAAMTDVDGCESEFEKAYRINGIGPGNLARAAFEIDAGILHLSTDYVFDGEKESPYYEDDPVCPMSAYGRSKLAGETFVRSNNQRHWIVRTQWLYGPGGKNFVDTIVKAAKARDSLDVVDDQFGCPTFTKDLAAQVVRIVDLEPPHGVYNCSNEGSCSWFDLAKRIVSIAGPSHVEVRPMSSDKLDRPARRPAHSVLENFHLKMTIGNEMRNWDEALLDYLSPGDS